MAQTKTWSAVYSAIIGNCGHLTCQRCVSYVCQCQIRRIADSIYLRDCAQPSCGVATCQQNPNAFAVAAVDGEEVPHEMESRKTPKNPCKSHEPAASGSGNRKTQHRTYQRPQSQ